MVAPVAIEVSKAKSIEKTLLTELANEAHVSDWQNLRWFAVGGDKPRAIIVMTRGANKHRVATISANKTPDAWESWKPVLDEWLAERARTNKGRVSHKKLKTGKL